MAAGFSLSRRARSYCERAARTGREVNRNRLALQRREVDVRRDNAAVQPRDSDRSTGHSDAAGATGEAVVVGRPTKRSVESSGTVRLQTGDRSYATENYSPRSCPPDSCLLFLAVIRFGRLVLYTFQKCPEPSGSAGNTGRD